MKKLAIIILTLLLVMLITGCDKIIGNKELRNPATVIPEIVLNTKGSNKWNEVIDYSKSSNWVALPDSINKDVDLIYFYPTLYTPSRLSNESVSDIDDKEMRRLAEEYVSFQAAAFSESCNIFVPAYRQLDMYYVLYKDEEERDQLFKYSSQCDPTDALSYYFEHYNNGRPFIIAGHSQGSAMTLFLLEDYFKNHSDYYDRMVAAYVVGYSVTDKILEEYPHIKFAQGADDTGVTISWNTEGPENIGQYNCVVSEGAKCINPINWKTDDTYASVEENLGSVIWGEQADGLADAQINLERGSLITNADKEFALSESELFGPASFHDQDYGLYFVNIQENAKQRIAAYFRK